MAEYTHNELAPDSLAARDLRHILHPTTVLTDVHKHGPQVNVKAKGVYLWDEAGNQYIEGMAGLWCTALGYGVEELAEVAAEQIKRLSYSQLFAGMTNEPSVLLAEKLKGMLPFNAGRIFFGLSGSDANDTQIKLQWYYHNLIGKPRKKKIISRWSGYHGVSIGAGSLTGLAPFHNHFDLPIAEVLHTNSPNYYREAEDGETEEEFSTRMANNLEDLIQKEDPATIAAFVAEPVLCAGGVIVPPATYYEKIQAVLQKYRIHFIDDEVICGFGRTGNAFGCETMGIEPTTMSMAKALSSAYLPISAVAIPEFMYDAFVNASSEVGVFGHGFTYTGHPVCAAVALRNLEIMEERKLFEHAAQVSVAFQDRLQGYRDHPLVGDVRGVGLLGAVEVVKSKGTKEPFTTELGVAPFIQQNAKSHGLIIRTLQNIVAFCPPLIITEDQIDELFCKFDRTLEDTLEFVRNNG